MEAVSFLLKLNIILGLRNSFDKKILVINLRKWSKRSTLWLKYLGSIENKNEKTKQVNKKKGIRPIKINYPQSTMIQGIIQKKSASSNRTLPLFDKKSPFFQKKCYFKVFPGKTKPKLPFFKDSGRCTKILD